MTCESDNNNIVTSSHHHKKANIPRKWSQLSYAGESRVPPAEEPKAGTWPTYFLKRDEYGNFVDNNGDVIAFNIRQPDFSIDFEGEQLDIVKDVINNITDDEIDVAEYWGDGPATKQWVPIVDILIDTYNISAPRAARILASFQSALNDAFVVAWYFKFLWDIARPNQLDQNLATVLCTPRHPTYPSGHATVAGCAQVVLSYFFKPESDRLKELAQECAVSRLYAGVHFPIDNDEGLNLGRQIGKIIVSQLKKQYDKDLARVDNKLNENTPAVLPPPPYVQVIPYERDMTCDSKVIGDYCKRKFYKKLKI